MRALEDDPDCAMAWAARAGILVQQTDKAYCEEAERSIRAGAAANGNERERAHLEAARHWLEGRIHEATTSFARIAQENPRDLIALQSGACRLLLSRPPERAARLAGAGAARVPPQATTAITRCSAWRRSATRNAATMRAPMRSAARPSSSMPRDGWAVHAVAHVNEMRGDVKTGIPWLRDSADSWAPESGFAFHNWWHLALLHLDNGATDEVLKLYDDESAARRFAGRCWNGSMHPRCCGG